MPVGTVLVVDNGPVLVNLFQGNFEINGYPVLAACTGEAGRSPADDPS